MCLVRAMLGYGAENDRGNEGHHANNHASLGPALQRVGSTLWDGLETAIRKMTSILTA